MCKAHQHEEYGFQDVVTHLLYLEEHYGGTYELTLAATGEATNNALLCLTAADYCPNMGHKGFQTVVIREVPSNRLRNVPASFQEMLYEVQEAIEGACPYCRGVDVEWFTTVGEDVIVRST